jgi:serine/threonine protein kinase/tetratricopeptide (TPR) repeat protein
MDARPCLDPNELDALATGRAETSLRARGEAHVDSCNDCRRLLVELARIYGTSGALPKDLRSIASAPTMPAQAASDAPPGAQVNARPSDAPMLGRYRLGERLGAGGMGVVFAAHDPELDRRVAIKLLHPDPSGAPEEQRARLLREAQAMARLSHPNVVAVYDVGRVGEQVFVAVELVEGTTVTRWLEHGASGPRSQDEILRMFVAAGRGLAAAHAVGLVHRDFKPDNVLIGRDGRPRVTDFGLAKPIDRAHAPGLTGTLPQIPESARDRGTAAGTIVGTPAYMSREQLRGELADARSDQFSFCVSLYEALFGTRPFVGRTLAELVANVDRGNVVPPPASAPRWLRQLLLRGLSMRPEDRFPDMAALLTELERDRGRTRRIGLTALGMVGGAAAIVGILAIASNATSSAGRRSDGSSSSGSSSAPSSAPSASLGGGAAVADPDTCGGASIVDHFAESDRATLLEHVKSSAGTAIGDGAHLEKRLGEMLDAYVARWKKAHRAACKTGGPNLALAFACLDDRRRAFEGLTRALAKSGNDYVNKALLAAERLPSIARCTDDAHLPTLADLAAVDVAGKIEILRSDLAELRADVDLTAIDAAEPIAEHVLDDAKSIGHPGALAEAELAKGYFQAYFRHWVDSPDAVDTLTSAVGSAKAARRDDLALSASLELVRLVGTEALREKDAEGWVRLVDSALPSLDADGTGDPYGAASARRTLATYDLHRFELVKARDRLEAAAKKAPLDGGSLALLARIDLAQDFPSLAVEHAQNAVARIEDEARYRDDPRLAHALLVLGDAYEAKGDREKAARARARVEKLVMLNNGIHTELHALMYEALGRDAIAKKDWAAADKDLGFAKSTRRGVLDVSPKEGITLQIIAEMRIAQGKPKDGVAAIDEATKTIESVFGKEDPRLIELLRARAKAQVAAGDLRSARTSLERALAIAEKAFGYTGATTAPILGQLGDVERALHEDQAALDHYDRAIVVLSKLYGLSHARIAENLTIRGDLSLALRGKEEARRMWKAALDDIEERLGASHPQALALKAKLASL